VDAFGEAIRDALSAEVPTVIEVALGEMRR